ncbi:MAG: hypothetical protein KF861_19550, partial [Planctomycetaceae bacterium]|nr:hypothetical protein [Planctomycetaceae bacterium]
MSHSIRRLWTGAIVLLMGCHTLPSTMTNLFDYAQAEPAVSERAVAASGASAPLPKANDQQGSPPASDAAASLAAMDFGWSDPPPADRATELFASAEDQHQLTSGSLPPAADLTDDSGREASTTLQAAPRDDGRTTRRFRGKPSAALTAPTPFSAIARDAAKEEPPAENTKPAPQPTTTPFDDPQNTGFVGSMFDVFGINGDRSAKANRKSPGTVQPASTARLERADLDRAASPSTGSMDALRESLQTVHWQEELDRLTALLETQLTHQTPGETSVSQDYYLRQHVALRLLYLIGRRHPEALQAIPDCDPHQQEFWTEVLWALSDIFDDEASPDHSVRARETASRLRAALAQIAPQAGLQLTHTLFCRQINGFGSYTPFERDEFTPGQSVLVYTEVENFVSRAMPDGHYVTALQSTLRIHSGDATGPIVFDEPLPA